MSRKRVGILTGGGDAPGLNAVIRAFVKRAVGQLNWHVVGIEDSFNGLMSDPHRVQKLTPKSCQGLLHRGGTILGTTNRGDPFAYLMPNGEVKDLSKRIADGVLRERLDGLVVIGGDGTQAIGLRLMSARGIPVVGVPKTIDNDLSSTDVTFGFQSAVDVATEALDRLHTTGESHDRVMFLEVMGRDAGHIALTAGIAGGADVILIPEIPYVPKRVAEKIETRRRRGRPFSIVVVAEGALPVGHETLTTRQRKEILSKEGGAAAIAMRALCGEVSSEMRSTVLGHLQRGGSPCAFDRVLATRFGAHAVDLVANDLWGSMVCIRDGAMSHVSIEDAVETYRLVDPAGELVTAAQHVGVEFGGL